MTQEIGIAILHSKFHFAASNLKFSIVPSLLWIFFIRAIKSSTTSSTKGRYTVTAFGLIIICCTALLSLYHSSPFLQKQISNYFIWPLYLSLIHFFQCNSVSYLIATSQKNDLKLNMYQSFYSWKKLRLIHPLKFN